MTLKEMREAAGMRQIDVARKLCSSLSSVHNWESGRVVPSRYYAHKLASLYGTTRDEIEGASKSAAKHDC